MSAAVVIGLLVKVTLLFLLVWGATIALRRRTAALRHLLWATGLAGALVLPLFELAPGWRVLPWPGVRAAALTPTDVPALAPEVAMTRDAKAIKADSTRPSGDAPGSMAGATDSPLATSAVSAVPAVAGGALPRRGPMQLGPAGPPGPAGPLPSGVGEGATTAAAPSSPLGAALFGIWGLGVAFLLGRLVLGFCSVGRIARSARRVERGRCREALDSALDQVGVRRAVTLRVSAEGSGPMTWGWLQPVVVLPAAAEQWPSARLRAVLHHEVAHIARRDCLVQLIGRVTRCLYWFHPFAWLANRGLHLEQERACDDIVLRAGVPASAYAEDLMCIAQGLRPMPSAALVSTAIARPSELMGRMEYLLDGRQVRARLPRGVRLAMIGGALLLSGAIGVVRPAADVSTGPQGKQGKQGEQGEQGSQGKPVAEHPLAARLVGLLDLPSYRAQTIRELVGLGAPALPSIARALGDPREPVALAAVEILAQLARKEPAAAPILISALAHPRPAVRAAATLEVGSFGSRAQLALSRLQKSQGRSAQLSEALTEALVVAAQVKGAQVKATAKPPAVTGPGAPKGPVQEPKPEPIQQPAAQPALPPPTLVSLIVANYSDNRVVEFDAQGRQVFVLEERFGVWDVECLANGNLLITEFSVNRVSEVTRRNEVVWSFSDLKNPYDADRLANGNTLIADTFGRRVIEVDPKGQIVWKYDQDIHPYDVDRLANGNTLIADTHDDRVIEVSPQGEIVWQIRNVPNVHDADRLPNGNTLLTIRMLNEVREVDPQGAVVWRLVNLVSPSDADRLPDGSTLVAENGFVRRFSSSGEETMRVPVTWAVEANATFGSDPVVPLAVRREVEELLQSIGDGDKRAVKRLETMRQAAYPLLLEKLPSARPPRELSAIMQVLLQDATAGQSVAIVQQALLWLRAAPAEHRWRMTGFLARCMSGPGEAYAQVLKATAADLPGRAECYQALASVKQLPETVAAVLIGRLPTADDAHAQLIIDSLGSWTTPSAAVIDTLLGIVVGHANQALRASALRRLIDRGPHRDDIARRLAALHLEPGTALAKTRAIYLMDLRFDAKTYVPPGLLVADYSDNRIVEFDAEGREVFKLENIFGVWDVETLANGNLLLTEFSVNRVSEVTREHKVVWKFDDLKNPYDADRLANGNTLIADTFGRRVIEVDPKGQIVWKYDQDIHPYDVDRLANGNTLIADTHDDRVIEVSPQGKIVWQIRNVPNVHDADRLPDGNTLLTIRMLNEVREVDREGRTVLQIKDLSSPSDADRLADGTTVVAENGFVRIFSPGGRELYRKKVRWAVEVNAVNPR